MRRLSSLALLLGVGLSLTACGDKDTSDSGTSAAVGADGGDGTADDDVPSSGDEGSGGDGTDGSDGTDGGDGTDPEGDALYATHCASCHGDDATGTAEGPGLAGEVSRHSDGELIQVILEGHGDMPAIDVTEDEAQRIVDHLRVLFG